MSNISKSFYLACDQPFSYLEDTVSSIRSATAQPTFNNSSDRTGFKKGILTEFIPNKPIIESDPTNGRFLGYKAFKGRPNLLSSQDLSS